MKLENAPSDPPPCYKNQQKNIKKNIYIKNINKHRKIPFGVFWSSGLWWSFLMVVVWSLVVFFVGLCWYFLMFIYICFLIFFDRFWWSSGGQVKLENAPSDPPPCYKNHQKPSKNINKHKKHQKRPFVFFWSSGLWWSFLMVVVWSLVVFFSQTTRSE